jgi:hypothetical protein
LNIGFDERNLNAAVEKVMALAKDKEQETIWIPGGDNVELFRLTDPLEVREYLMRRAEAAYQKATSGLVAQIVDMPYASIGILFEEHKLKMLPEPITRSPEKPVHLAYFWEVL